MNNYGQLGVTLSGHCLSKRQFSDAIDLRCFSISKIKCIKREFWIHFEVRSKLLNEYYLLLWICFVTLSIVFRLLKDHSLPNEAKPIATSSFRVLLLTSISSISLSVSLKNRFMLMGTQVRLFLLGHWTR